MLNEPCTELDVLLCEIPLRYVSDYTDYIEFCLFSAISQSCLDVSSAVAGTEPDAAIRRRFHVSEALDHIHSAS